MKNFWANAGGQVAIVFTLVVPILMGGLGLAVDYTAWTAQDRKLQGVADAAALAAARELYLANASDSQIEAVARSVAMAQVANAGGSTTGLSVKARLIDGRSAVEVGVSQQRVTYFADFLATSLPNISADAVARAVGGGRLCVLALDEAASTAVSLRQEAQINAATCAVVSNSTSSSGVDVANKALIAAELICSAGGVDGSNSAFIPGATTDCPPIPDPLSDRPAPTYSGCDYTNYTNPKGVKGLQILYPGVYCGGIRIAGGDFVLESGIYVIENGEFWIGSGAVLNGENVGFYLAGNKTIFYLESNSVVNLTAPKDGPMAGILFFEDRSAPANRTHEISSNKASILLGTFYLSRGILSVSSNAPVAEGSAWTAIIANRIALSAKPNLVLNTGYGQTDIPVPSGVNRTGSNIILER